MEFEFDQRKSEGNKAKHGIDFVEAQALWSDEDSVEFRLTAADEPRYMRIGMIAGKYWSAIITYRESRTRIISVRRSRKEEVAIYEKEENNG